MPRLVKPNIIGEFDKGLAKSLGVQALYMLDDASGTFVDLMTLTSAALTSGGRAVVQEGRVVTFDGTQQQALSHPSINTYSLDAYVVCGRILATAQQAGNPGHVFGVCSSSGTQAAVGIGFDNSASPKAGVAWLAGSGAGLAAGVTVGLNKWCTVYAQGGGNGTNPLAWVDGLPAPNISGASGGVSTINEITFGAQHRAAGFLRNAKAQMLWGAILRVNSETAGTNTPYGFSDAEAWNLYASDFPYNLFRKSRRLWPAAAANGSVGSSSGSATASAVGASTAASAASSAGAATAAAAGASIAAAAGSSAASASVTGVGAGTSAAAGASSGTGAASAVGASTAGSAGASAGAATASAAGASTAAAAGSSAGSATVSGVSSSAGSAGTSAGSATATAVGASTNAASGASSGVASTSGVGASTAAGAGASSGAATTSGVGAATKAAAGSSAGVATVTGVGATATNIQSGAGSSAASATASGVGAATAAAVGSAAGVATANATTSIAFVQNAERWISQAEDRVWRSESESRTWTAPVELRKLAA